jgi:MFS family permease
MTRTTQARWAMASLALSMLMPSLDTSIANVALPSLTVAFGASFQQAQWIALAYLLAVTILIVGAGRIGDMLGRRRMLVAGIGVFTGASLLCGVAPTLWFLIGARAAQGVGAAMMIALTMALAGDAVPKTRTGSAMGLLGTMSALGTTLGPSLGGVLIAFAGWRTIFLVNVPLGILNIVLALRTLPADRPSASAPAVPLRLSMLRNVALSTGLAVSTLISAVMMATLVVGPFYLSRALALDSARVGLFMSVGPFVAALTGLVAGRVVDRAGTRATMMFGVAGMTAGLVALGAGAGRYGIAGYLAGIVILTAHYALVQVANTTSLMSTVSDGQRGVTAGMLGLARNLGLISGASALGAVYAFTSAADKLATEASSAAAGMRATFLVAAGLTGVALLALAIADFASHTGRHDASAGHHRTKSRPVGHCPVAARGARDEAVQPEVAPGTRRTAEVDPAAA